MSLSRPGATARWSRLACAWLLLWSAGIAQATPLGGLAEARVVRSMRLHGLPSVSVAVGRDGQVLWADAFGLANREEGRPASTDTAYSVASITKPITVVAILMLAERGLIDLDAPINRYLGAAKLVARIGNAEDATVRRVLTHRAGLPLHFHYLYEDEAPPQVDMDEAIRRYGVLVTAPGETRQYSNFGYGLLGQVVERVSGRSYAQFVQEEIFVPLGMHRSFVATGPDRVADAAQKYVPSGMAIPFYDTDHRGAAAIYASAPDLVRFGQFLIDAAAGRSPLLSAGSLAAMTSDAQGRRNQDEFFGLGIAVWKHRGHEVWHQSGSMPGVSAQLLVSPDLDLVVAVLINRTLAPDWSIANDVAGVFAPELDRRGQAIRGAPHLAGRWDGRVFFPGAPPQPVSASFDEGGAVALSLADRPLHVVQTRNLEDGFFEITSLVEAVPGIVGPEVSELRFKLKLRGERLAGSVAVRDMPGEDRVGSGLSYWADLHRLPVRASLPSRDVR